MSPIACRDTDHGHTYQRLQLLQVSQSLAQEPSTGRLGGQERIHGHRATHGPIQQACRPDQKQLPQVTTAQSRGQGPSSEPQLVQ